VLVARGKEVDPGKQRRPDRQHHWHHPEKLLDVRDYRLVAEGCIQADLFGRDTGKVEPARSAQFFFAIDMIVRAVRSFPDPFVTQLDQIIAHAESEGFTGTYLNTCRRLAEFKSGFITKNALFNDRTKGAGITVCRNIERTCHHAGAASHTNITVVDDCAF